MKNLVPDYSTDEAIDNVVSEVVQSSENLEKDYKELVNQVIRNFNLDMRQDADNIKQAALRSIENRIDMSVDGTRDSINESDYRSCVIFDIDNYLFCEDSMHRLDEGFDNLYYSLSSSFTDKVFLISKTKTKLKESLLRKDILTDYDAEVLGINESFDEKMLVEEIFLKGYTVEKIFSKNSSTKDMIMSALDLHGYYS